MRHPEPARLWQGRCFRQLLFDDVLEIAEALRALHHLPVDEEGWRGIGAGLPTRLSLVKDELLGPRAVQAFVERGLVETKIASEALEPVERECAAVLAALLLEEFVMVWP